MHGNRTLENSTVVNYLPVNDGKCDALGWFSLHYSDELNWLMKILSSAENKEYKNK